MKNPAGELNWSAARLRLTNDDLETLRLRMMRRRGLDVTADADDIV